MVRKITISRCIKKKINKLVLGTNNQGKVEKLRIIATKMLKYDTQKD